MAKKPEPDKQAAKITFPAVRGVQAGREYYTAMVPLRTLAKLLTTREEDQDLPPELRAQRKLNKTRANKIADYVSKNPRDYTLSSLTVSIDAMPEFMTVAEDQYQIGLLVFPLGSKVLINDGQHRHAGLVEAVKENRDLGDESITVIFFVDAGLKRSQQMFTDLNKNVSKTSKALNVLYDHRDPIAELTKETVKGVKAWRGIMDMERPNPPRRSNKLHSLNNLYDANTRLLQVATVNKKEGAAPLVEFWERVAAVIPDWELAAKKKVTCMELRETSLHAHGIALLAIAETFKKVWRSKDAAGYIGALEGIDWSRTSEIWTNRCIVNGRIVKSSTSAMLTANVIKAKIGLELSVADREAETKFNAENS